MPQATKLVHGRTRAYSLAEEQPGAAPTTPFLQLIVVDPTPARRPSRPRRMDGMLDHLRLVASEASPAAAQGCVPGATRAFTEAARAQRASIAEFSAAASRMANQAEQLAETLKSLRFAGSSV